MLNRLTRITYADGSQIHYQYDQGPNGIGRLTGIADGNSSIAYGYDPHGRLLSDSRTIGGQVYVTSYHYDSAGRLSGLTYPDGRSIDYLRDSLGRVIQINGAEFKLERDFPETPNDEARGWRAKKKAR